MKYFFIDDKLNQVCDILNKHPAGLPKMQIAKMMGHAISRISNFTAPLRRDGRIEYIGGVKFGRWVLARHLPYALRQLEIDKGPRLMRRAKSLAVRKESAAGSHESWAEKPPVRILVSANDAPPIIKRGPASIWELAG